MKKFFYVLLGILGVLTYSCKNTNSEDPFFTLKETAVSFQKEFASKILVVETNIENWSISVPREAQSWLRAKKVSGGIEITVSKNSGVSVRSADLLLKAGNITQNLRVQQLGSEFTILPAPDNFSVEKHTSEITVTVTANTAYDMNIEGDWVTQKSVTDLEDNSGKVYVFSIARNQNEEGRTARVKFTQKDAAVLPIESIVTINQQGEKGFEPGKASSIPTDFKVVIERGTTTSFQPNSPVEKLFDGDYSASGIYHSNWNNRGTNYFPITWELFLKESENVDYMMYYPRPSGVNGLLKETEIWVATEQNPNYVKVKEVNFGGSNDIARVVFDTPIVKAKSFKIVVRSGAGDGQGFAAAAEIEFWRKNTSSVDITSIFTDGTCSELKPSVTEEQIEAISDNFYKNIAYYMKKNQYPKEFRIQEVRAWANPNIVRDHNRMSYAYSNLDNPTGMSFTQGEEVVVFVGPTQGRKLKLKIQNLNKPGGDGFDQASYHPLYEGVNKFIAGQSGLGYVQYQAEDYEAAPRVKVHFATGKVNGYFDKLRHNDQDWSRLLSNATNKYFDVVGERAHLCFPTADFRTYTKTKGKQLIEIYDDLVEKTHEFSGTVGNRQMKNRAYFQVMYTGFMYCTAYRTSYNQSTMSGLCNPETLKDNIWGPAHEIGHAHQVGPVFKWIGMTECTVNMNSMNTQTEWGKNTRLQTERLGSGENSYGNRYEKAYNVGIVPEVPFSQMNDVFCNLVPFWQINLYFQKVKGEYRFAVRLYEKLRTIPLKAQRHDGEYQVDFTKTVSEVTNTDLTNFFERWGFYRPISQEVTDYQKLNLVVTKEYADKIKSEIKALNKTAITDKIEYICDANWTYFRDKTPVTKGTATRSGNVITTSGYKGVVAYEVYQGGKLIFVTNLNTFNIKRNWNSDTKVYAIAYNGQKTEVTF